MLVVGFVTAKAELPPSAYERFQSGSSRVFQIKVDQVSSKFPGVFDRSKRIESVEATVVKVVSSKSGTKVGDKISFGTSGLFLGRLGGAVSGSCLGKSRNIPPISRKRPMARSSDSERRGRVSETVKSQ